MVKFSLHILHCHTPPAPSILEGEAGAVICSLVSALAAHIENGFIYIFYIVILPLPPLS